MTVPIRAMGGFGLIVAVCLMLALAACTSKQQVRDLEDIAVMDPDRAEIYNNVDQYPNITRICIDGVAFATLTRDYEPILRVPEWDATFCNTERGAVDDGAEVVG